MGCLCFLVCPGFAQVQTPKGYHKEQTLIMNFDGDDVGDTIVLVSDGQGFHYKLILKLSSRNKPFRIDIVHPFAPGQFPVYPGKLTHSRNVLQYGFGTPGTANYSYFFKLRYKPEVQKIQLIGFDYSYKSGAAGSARTTLSFNLLTGDFIWQEKYFGSQAGKKAKRRKGVNKNYRNIFSGDIDSDLILQLTQIGSNKSYPLKKEINVLLDSIRANGFLWGSGMAGEDSMAAWNNRLMKSLKVFAEANPGFMDNENPFGKNSRLSICTSGDHQFRIICWNDGMSGTMQEWRALAVWKAGKKIYSKELKTNEDPKNPYAPFPEYWDIMDYTLQNGKTVYWVRGIGHGSNRIKISFVKAFAITKSGQLNDQYLFFKTPHKTLNHISLTIDLITAPRDDYNPYIHLSEDAQTMYVPVADKDGKLTVSKHLIYQFDGKYFVYQGIK